jgi:hypothetical protein
LAAERLWQPGCSGSGRGHIPDVKYVRAHGSIGRSDAAELRGIGPRQAGYLLGMLAAIGKLRLVGVKGNARYTAGGLLDTPD